MNIENDMIEIKINAGWIGGSAAKKMARVTREKYSDWEVVNAVPNYVNPVRRLFFAVIGIISLGFYMPTAGYVIILKRAKVV